MWKFVPVLFLLLFYPFCLLSQPDLFRSSKSLNQSISYTLPEGEHFANGNKIIREIAPYVQREPWLVRLDLSCKYQVSVGLQDGKKQVTGKFLDPHVMGDIFYRRFDISEVLIPSHLQVTIRWANRFDSSSYTEQRALSGRIGIRDSILFQLPAVHYDPDLDTIILCDFDFFYDSLQLTRFRQRRQLIDDYYASSVLLDTLQQVADTMDVSNPALLPLHFIQVEEFNKVLQQISSRNFPENLLDSGFDPAQIGRRYQELYRISKTLTYNYRDALYEEGGLPWDLNMAGIAGFFTARMFSFVGKSQWMDDFHGDIYRDYLDHYFDRISFPVSENIPEMLLRKMYPESQHDTLVSFVAKQVLSSYCRLARMLMERYQYAEAVSLIENARKFRAAVPGKENFKEEDSLLVQASTEVYNAFTGIAYGCIRNQKYQMADEYLAKAAEYRLMHPGLIHADSLYRKVYSELFFLRNTGCDQLLDQKKYLEALDCYRLFEQNYAADELVPVSAQLNKKKKCALSAICIEAIIQSLAALKHDKPDSAIYYFDVVAPLLPDIQDDRLTLAQYDSVAPLIDRIRYKYLLNAGKQALDHRQYTLALQNFDKARALGARFLIVAAESDSLYRRAMKEHVLIELNLAQKDIWASRFGEAAKSLGQITESGSVNGLGTDRDFVASTVKFRERIVEQKCRDLNDSVTYWMIRADRALALKNFRNAGIYLRQALRMADSIPACGLPVASIADSLEKYTPALLYQENLENAGKWVSSGGYDTAIVIVYDAEKKYVANQLEHVGCVHESLFDFINSRNNPYLTFQAIQFYQKKGDDSEAFLFLKLLQKQDYQAGNTRIIQEQLGTKLAQLDFSKSGGSLSGGMDLPLAAEEKWFRQFREAYQNEWTRLIRSSVPVH